MLVLTSSILILILSLYFPPLPCSYPLFYFCFISRIVYELLWHLIFILQTILKKHSSTSSMHVRRYAKEKFFVFHSFSNHSWCVTTCWLYIITQSLSKFALPLFFLVVFLQRCQVQRSEEDDRFCIIEIVAKTESTKRKFLCFPCL